MSEQDHLLSRLGMRDVEDTDERLVIEMDNRPDLVNIRGAIQGGLVATLITSLPDGSRAPSPGRSAMSPPQT